MNTHLTCTINHIDHVGVAVKDIQAALEFFQRVFGAPPSEVAELADQGVRATLIRAGQTRLELLEPLSESTAVGRGCTTWPSTWATCPASCGSWKPRGWSWWTGSREKGCPAAWLSSTPGRCSAS